MTRQSERYVKTPDLPPGVDRIAAVDLLGHRAITAAHEFVQGRGVRTKRENVADMLAVAWRTAARPSKRGLPEQDERGERSGLLTPEVRRLLNWLESIRSHSTEPWTVEAVRLALAGEAPPQPFEVKR